MILASPFFAGRFFYRVVTFAIALATAAGLSASEPTGPRTDGSAFAIWSAGWRGGIGIFEKFGTEWVSIGGSSCIS